MDTDKLNRELQIFRNHVKIARENVIHKLVRDIKFWQAKRDANGDNKRAAKKVDSLQPLMGHIRSMPASELAKAVIRFNPKKDGTSAGQVPTVEERALMRFYENKKLYPEVKALIRRFALSSKMEVLDKYLKNRGDGKKGKEKGKKRKKTEKGKGKKGAKGKSEEQESEDQGFCEDAEDKKQAKVEDEESGSDASEESISASDLEASDSEPEEEAGKFVKLTPAKPQVQKKKSAPKAEPKKSAPKADAKKSDKPKEKPKQKDFKPPEEEDDEDKCVQIQDSFFVTNTGQSYVATAPVVDKKQLAKEEQEEYSWKRSLKKKDALGNRVEKEDQTDFQPAWKAKQQQNQQKDGKPFQGHRKQRDNDGEPFVKKPRVNQPDSDVHPSWAAKQKQRGLQQFSGKKIQFDAKESKLPASKPEPAEDLHPSWAAKQKQKGIKPFSGKKIVFGSDAPAKPEPKVAAIDEDVHPSWAAKQKQKGIKPFSGKKIVFDGSDAPAKSEPTPAEDVHPSWAAKQKQKGLKPFQGKKIVFDSASASSEQQPQPRSKQSQQEPPTAAATTAAELHPSWAAKQKEKGIQEFRGKKITFDD